MPVTSTASELHRWLAAAGHGDADKAALMLLLRRGEVTEPAPTKQGCQYSSKVQQRPHCLTRSASSRSVRASVNNGTNGYCAEFTPKRSLVRTQYRPLFRPLSERGFDCACDRSLAVSY